MMPKFETIKGVLFDLDGVITDTSVYHEQAWHELADQLQIDWQPAFAEQLKGVSREASLAVLLNATGHPNDYSAEQKAQFATEKNDRYLALLQQLSPAAIAPGMTAFLTALKAQNYRIGLASASKNAPFVLERLGLSDYFQARSIPRRCVRANQIPKFLAVVLHYWGYNPLNVLALKTRKRGFKRLTRPVQSQLGLGPKTC